MVAASFDFIILVHVERDARRMSYISGAPRRRGTAPRSSAAWMEPMSPVEAVQTSISGRWSVSGLAARQPCRRRMKMLNVLSRATRSRPQVERFPMSQVNAAMDHLRAGKARHRIIPRRPTSWIAVFPIHAVITDAE
jgi:D-arabinose 1-dehydrogenase-like Zn-dependent alcohol dehydrogenase